MIVTIDARAYQPILDGFVGSDIEIKRTDLGGFGTFFVSTDDNAMLSVLVVEQGNKLYEFYTQLNAMQSMTKYVYLVVIGKSPASQLLAVQEMGVMTACIDSFELLPNFVKFIANPKRREEKKILPARNVRIFTPAEQILMTIDGLGAAKVGAILNHFGSLATALSILSWYDADEYMPGVISKKTIQDWRNILGIPDGHVVYVAPKEDEHA